MTVFRGAAAVAFALALVAVAPAAAANKDAGAANKDIGASILPGAGSRAPVSIEADKLVYFDKEQKAVYTGNVVVIQGDSKLTCSALTIFMDKGPAPGGAAPSPAANAAAGPGSSSSHVKHLDCAGPVTVISKTQVATGDRGSFDKPQNKVWLFGNVTLSDGGNITKGDKLTYDLTTGEATIDAGRVKGLFIPGSGAPGGDDKTGASK
jgi:lipopolysaccharide export system protein LptA